jgi:hypothetical protein
MSLNILFINKVNNEVVNAVEPTILIDDYANIAKDKLFAFKEGIDYIPNLIKMEIQNENEYISITDSNSLLYYMKENTDNNIIYVTNIINDIEKRIENNEINIIEIFEDDKKFENLYEDVKKTGYIDLTEEDLEFVIKVMLLKNHGVLYSNLQGDVEEYITSWFNKQAELNEKYSEMEEGLDKFYDLVKTLKTEDYMDYIEYDNEIVVEYTSVSILIRGKSYETGVKGRFIKLTDVFNQIELSENVPFVAISTMGDPMIKVYNKLINETPEREIRSWVLNEKKKLNMISYKKIKGLLIKYKNDDDSGRYVTINIQENGMILVKIVFADDTSETDLTYIIEYLKSAVEKVIDMINKLQSVFYKSKRIEYIKDSDVYIDSITGYIDTKYLIDKEQFAKTLANTIISENIFELKETISEDIISLYYKKYGKREGDDIETEKKGITVNIKDNPYKLNSSIINIFGAYNIYQIWAIIKQIVIISKLSQKDTKVSKQKLKEKSHIKTLRKQGVKILSTKCQKPRQPVIGDNTTPLENSYTLEYEGIKYVCPKKDYPYPGFTNENIVCCFKKDQRRQQKYIRNVKPSDADITVQPSNFKIKITEDNKTYETYAIRIVSDYIDGFDEENSMPRYYYISNNNELVGITNSKLLNKIQQEEENNIWLDEISLTNIISEPPKNKCNYTPILTKKNTEDINAPCEHHEKNKIFGYNLNSYPCCFDKERDVYISRKRKIADITKQHILTSDKSLDYQRIGILPSGIDMLFNNLIKTSYPGQFYRMGVIQNHSAFINAILMAINNKIDEQLLNNSNEFRKYISNYILANPDEYKELNGGNIANKYGDINNYTNTILDSNVQINWIETIDILQRITKTNIMIVDIPYIFSESTKVADYQNIKLICTQYVKMDKNNPFIIMIKRMNTFELIVQIDMKKVDEVSTIKYIFEYDEKKTYKTNIVNFLLDYYTSSCVKESVYPENYPYDEPYTINKIIEKLTNSKHEINGQVINKFNKITYVITKSNILIPVKETGIYKDLKTVTIKEIMENDELLDIIKYEKSIKELNKLIDNKIDIRGATIKKTGDETIYTSVLTNFGILVPVKETKRQEKDNIILLDFKYYQDIDDVLFDKENTTLDGQMIYNNGMKELRQKIYETKVELAKGIVNDDNKKTEIMNINIKTDMSKYDKIKEIIKIFKNIIGEKSNEFILSYIANEVINDNIENLLLNNLVTSDVFNPKEVIVRDSESVLANIDDILKWIRKYKIE